MKETDTHVSLNYMPAVYKGQKVAVYTVDKTELSLSRQDLVELVNVGCFLIPFVLLGRIAVLNVRRWGLLLQTE